VWVAKLKYYSLTIIVMGGGFDAIANCQIKTLMVYNRYVKKETKMSSFHFGSNGLLGAVTTFGAMTTGVAFVPSLTTSTYIRIIALVSYILVIAAIFSFILKRHYAKKSKL
jgi:cytochrome c biogenesis protein CcdA